MTMNYGEETKRLTKRVGGEVVIDEAAMQIILDKLVGYEDSKLLPEELDEMLPQDFGGRLQFLRSRTLYNQREFAQFLGIPQSSLSAYENNRVAPTVRVLKIIAERCHVSLDWLCGS